MDQNEIKIYKKKSQFKSVWKRLNKNKAAVIGLVIFVVLALGAIFADFITNYDKNALALNVANRLQPSSGSHLFGTDQFGRDVFARIIHGARYSLTLGSITVIISIIIGGIFGAIAAYYSGLIDGVIMRIMDTIMCIPYILLALALVAALGPGIENLLIAVTIALVPSFARVIRAVVLPVVGQDFIEAAKACGTSVPRIILKHIIPNAVGPIIVQGTMTVASAIIAASSLSFIGMGIQPPTPEWGSMLSEAKEFMRTTPLLLVFPGIVIMLASLSLNLLGDGLRDALDPRLKN